MGPKSKPDEFLSVYQERVTGGESSAHSTIDYSSVLMMHSLSVCGSRSGRSIWLVSRQSTDYSSHPLPLLAHLLDHIKSCQLYVSVIRSGTTLQHPPAWVPIDPCFQGVLSHASQDPRYIPGRPEFCWDSATFQLAYISCTINSNIFFISSV